ncbi:DEAD/DEAH box helicase [[Mycoplasma] testudinis]|uniref:DEAD/DEAH box helicase n=1 Tax=[Mycoplasma] testudinis TaxID=33924 RepID=UPI000695C8A1|nr:DEAD/DEAH box helicase [[Mycoplasma] testudinis]
MTEQEIKDYLRNDALYEQGKIINDHENIIQLTTTADHLTYWYADWRKQSYKIKIVLDHSRKIQEYECNCPKSRQIYLSNKCMHLAAALIKNENDYQKLIKKHNYEKQSQIQQLDDSNTNKISNKKIKPGIVQCTHSRFIFKNKPSDSQWDKTYANAYLFVQIDDFKPFQVFPTKKMFSEIKENKANSYVQLFDEEYKEYWILESAFNDVDLKLIELIINEKGYDILDHKFFSRPKIETETISIYSSDVSRIVTQIGTHFKINGTKKQIIKFLNAKSQCFNFVSSSSSKTRVICQQEKANYLRIYFEINLNQEWVRLFNTKITKDGTLNVLENFGTLSRILLNESNFYIYDRSFFTYYSYCAHKKIKEFYILDENKSLIKIDRYFPKLIVKFKYNQTDQKFEKKVEYHYYNNGSPFKVSNSESSHEKERNLVYEAAVLNYFEYKVHLKGLANKAKVSQITKEMIFKLIDEYENFDQSDLIEYDLAKNLCVNKNLKFDYQDLEKISIIKNELIIKCKGMKTSIAELSEIAKKYNSHNDIVLTDECFYVLSDKSNKNFFEFWSKFDYYKAKNDVNETYVFPKFRVFDLLLAFQNDRKLLAQYADQSVLDILKTFKDLIFEKTEIKPPFNTILREYQQEGHYWLKSLKHHGFGGILADDMGLGKTVQAISLIAQAYHEDNLKLPTLIIAPTSLLLNWKAEFEKFAPDLKIQVIRGNQETREKIINKNKSDIEITSYAYFRNDIQFHKQKFYQIIILDEAQNIKNHTSKVSIAIKELNGQTKYALTGTPIENKLLELWSIFDFILPGLFGTSKDFIKDYERPIVRDENKVIVDRLKQKINTFILRRTKNKVLKELPPKTENDLVVELSDQHRKIYDEKQKDTYQHLKQLVASNEASKVRFEIFKLISELRQICCSPTLKIPSFNGENAKLQACLDLVEEAIENKQKILLFTQFLGMIDIFQEELQKRNIQFYVLKGDTKKEDRMKYVDAFNNDETPVFIASLKAGGVGLNLIGAEIVIHYDLWWNLAVQNQATDRVHRIGQSKAVQVYRIIAEKTIEERIVKIQESKKHLASMVVNDDTNVLSTLSVEDLIDLFKPEDNKN